MAVLEWGDNWGKRNIYADIFGVTDYTYPFPSEPVKIIQNGPVVIVFWKDKTKTIVRKKPDDPDDIYSAVAQAFMKKWCGSTSHFHKCIDKMVVKKEEPK